MALPEPFKTDKNDDDQKPFVPQRGPNLDPTPPTVSPDYGRQEAERVGRMVRESIVRNPNIKRDDGDEDEV